MKAKALSKRERESGGERARERERERKKERGERQKRRQRQGKQRGGKIGKEKDRSTKKENMRVYESQSTVSVPVCTILSILMLELSSSLAKARTACTRSSHVSGSM